ncbi:hypothetical protein F3K22_25015 [Streptomyces scabiei]|nr:hypothetical protein F3K22_25015 [Streptomyces sp. LBUM 1475]
MPVALRAPRASLASGLDPLALLAQQSPHRPWRPTECPAHALSRPLRCRHGGRQGERATRAGSALRAALGRRPVQGRQPVLDLHGERRPVRPSRHLRVRPTDRHLQQTHLPCPFTARRTRRTRCARSGGHRRAADGAVARRPGRRRRPDRLCSGGYPGAARSHPAFHRAGGPAAPPHGAFASHPQQDGRHRAGREPGGRRHTGAGARPRRPGPGVLVNAELLSGEGWHDHEEGCLSLNLPGSRAMVGRPRRVLVRALTPAGHRVLIQAGDYLARVLQHEIDHLDGIEYVQRLTGSEAARVYRAMEVAGLAVDVMPPAPYAPAP